MKKTLNWQECHQDVSEFTGATYECADIRVPLDYDRPFGSTVEVALARIPAADQENRIGSILMSPGGPGGSGVDFLLGFGPAAGFVFGPDVPAKFDLVGFDPRGIAGSSPVRCFNTVERAVEIFPPIGFPLVEEEIDLFDISGRHLARSCRRHNQARRVGQHVSTNNVARDMDVIRASIGDEYMNFLGLSYGTYVGAVYANLFPDRVRSVVVDGVLDPIAWVNAEAEVPFSTRLRSDEGAAETLDEFFRQCDAAAEGNCALAPNSEEKYFAALESALDGPILITDPGSGERFFISYQDLVGFTLNSLYSPPGYPFLAEVFSLIGSPAAAPEDIGVAVAAAEAALGHIQPYDNFVEGFPAVACVDTNGPKSYDDYFAAGQAAGEEFGIFGPLWTWASAPCPSWPFQDRDRYEGPFDTETANPVLVVGNLYDPATRYEGAQTLDSLLPNSALLTVDVAGHTSLGISMCAGHIVGQYLLDPSTAADSFCEAEFNAFDAFGPPPPPPEGAAAVAGEAPMVSVRKTIMEDVGMVPAASSLFD